MRPLAIVLLFMFVGCHRSALVVPEKPFVVVKKSPRWMKYDVWDYQYVDKNGRTFWTAEKGGTYSVGDTIK